MKRCRAFAVVAAVFAPGLVEFLKSDDMFEEFA